jgi:5'-nucleotidase/UDP-sugar diphosphatase
MGSEVNRMTRDCGCGHDEASHRGRPATDRSVVRQFGHTHSRRAVLAASAAGIAGTTLTGRGQASDAEDGDTVTIVHDLHTHSEIGEIGGPNIARYRTAIDEQLAANENSVFLTSGDELGSSPVSFFTEGAHKVEFMNELGITAAGVGNHDFDFGVETAQKRFEQCEFPWLNSALFTPDGDSLPNTERWMLCEVGDITLGLFNVVMRGFHNITDYPEEYEARDPVEVSEEMVETLENEGVDVIVLASHVAHDTHYEIAEEVDGLDAIFGSHSHVTFDEAEVHHDTVISEIGYAYDHLGALTLDSAGDLVEWERIDLDDEIEPEPTFDVMMRAQYADLEEEFAREVGVTDTPLDASGTVSNGRESRLGNLITDAMVDIHPDADIALQTAGRIRTSDTYGPGMLTVHDLLQILPFNDEVVVFQATGEQIREALSGRIDVLPDDSLGARQRQQVAGLSYEWSGHEEAEIHDVYVDSRTEFGENRPLDSDVTYTVVTTDYSKDIALGYESFRDAETLWESGVSLGPVVMEYIEERGRVAPEIEGRVLRVDADLGDGTDYESNDIEFSVRFDLPDEIETIVPESFYLLSRHGSRYEVQVSEDDGELIATGGREVAEIARSDPDHGLKLLGEFEPDGEVYDYEDDGETLSLPVSDAVEQFVCRGYVPHPNTER